MTLGEPRRNFRCMHNIRGTLFVSIMLIFPLLFCYVNVRVELLMPYFASLKKTRGTLKASPYADLSLFPAALRSVIKLYS